MNFSYRIEVCLGLIHRLTGQFQSVAELERGAGKGGGGEKKKRRKAVVSDQLKV